jgi:methyl-accepting chemotaxis protein
MKLPSLSIAAKLYTIFALLATATVSLSTLAALNSRHNTALTNEFERAFMGAMNVERVNGLIYAVVMESRGIYMSPDWKVAEPYGKLLLKRLGEMQETAKLWKEKSIEAERASIDAMAKGIDEFVRFRTELVRLAREENTAKAREFGDNDANRKVRQALNKELEGLAKAYLGHTEAARRELERIDALKLALLAGLAGCAAIMVVGGIIFVQRSLVRPIHHIRDAMTKLAGGDLEAHAEGADRRDEIGDFARAFGTFREAAVEKAAADAQAAAQRAAKEDERIRNDEAARIAAENEQTVVVNALADALNKMAGGDLTYRIEIAFDGRYQKLKDDFNRAISRLQDTLSSRPRWCACTAAPTRSLAARTIWRGGRSSRQPTSTIPPAPWTSSPPL